MKIDAIVMREIGMPLLYPFQTSFGTTTHRRILLIELQTEGISAWGECTAGEHPYFNEESIDTAWQVTEAEFIPRLIGKDVADGRAVPALLEAVRGHRMAKGAVESAVWEADATLQGVPLSKLVGGTRNVVPCGVSIGIQSSLEKQIAVVAKEVAAGYQRIKLKCKPGYDREMFAAVRERWPEILLSCDANSAYRLKDAEYIARWDEFKLLMIEQPMWSDDFYFHAELQRKIGTAICLDECIRNARDAEAALALGSGRILNIKLGRVGGFTEAIAVHDVAQRYGVPVWCGGMLEAGIGRSHNIALSSLPNFSLPSDVSASKRYWSEDIIEPEVTVSSAGEIAVPNTPGRGYELRLDRIENLTVRKLRFAA